LNDDRNRDVILIEVLAQASGSRKIPDPCYEFRAGIYFIDIDDAVGVGVRLISAQAKKRGKAKG
jgi:hypothetical protein